MEEARYYRQVRGKTVQCFLCKHHCLIADGKQGICGVRENRGGTLYSLVYGEIVASHVDPIEKKPLFHFLPGSTSYSIATYGCNFKCLNCQNADISQAPVEQGITRGHYTPPQEIVKQAVAHGCLSIAYTYTEPTIFFEYAFDVAKLAANQGLYNIFVTNGYVEKEPLQDIAPYLNAANIDLKSSNREFYTKICGGKLDRLLASIKLYFDLGVFIEITTLVIPDYNDSESDLNGVARFIANLDPTIPWHISRFHPQYKLIDHRSTPINTLLRAYNIGKEAGLQYVYLGNIPGTHENTFCPSCGKKLITRSGYFIVSNELEGKTSCPNCGIKIPGLFKKPNLEHLKSKNGL